jgi:uncharacterized cupin superfamily protein
MEHVAVDDVATTGRVADRRAGLTEPLGLSDAAINYFELAPGDGFSGGMHTHLDQEEVFYVLEGTATFETPETSVEVGAGEAIRFAPGEYQTGGNESDERVRGLAIGAPQDQGETRSGVECRDCGADYHEVHVDDGQMRLVCPGCGHEIEV